MSTSKNIRSKMLDITVFYPDSEDYKYVKGIDYNSDVLNSKFTSEISNALSKEIIRKVGYEFIISWNITTDAIPVLISLLKHDIYFIDMYTSDNECFEIVKSITTLLGYDAYCSISLSSTPTFVKEGLVYLSIDGPPKYSIGKNNKSILPGVVIVIYTKKSVSLKHKSSEAYTKTFGNFTLSILDRDLDLEIDFSEITPISEMKYDRKLKIEKIKSSKPVKAKRLVPIKRSVTTKEESPSRKSTTTKEESPSRKIPTTKAVVRRSPVVKTEEKRFTPRKIETEFKTVTSRGLTSRFRPTPAGYSRIPNSRQRSILPKNEKVSGNILKGDKYPDIKRLNLKNNKELEDGHPKVGGWIQFDEGVQNFYLFGVDDIKYPDRDMDRKSEEYEEALSDYIVSVIKLFYTPDEIDIEELVSERYMPLWLKVFTHETYDIENNYESLETLGDSGFAFTFLSFLYKKVPDIDRAEMTALKGNIGSKPSLRQVAWGLKMDTWLRMINNTKSNTNTAEDIVEAFCAVLQVSYTDAYERKFNNYKNEKIVYLPGKGIELLNAFLEFLFGSVVISKRMFRGDPKTVLIQSVQSITKENAIVEYYDNKGNISSYDHTIYLEWSDNAISFFKQQGVKMEKFIAEATSSSKSAVSSKVYNMAIENLESKGYSIAWLKNMKEKIKMQQFDTDLVNDVNKKAQKKYGKDTIVKFYIPSTLNTASSVTIALHAIVKDGSRKGKIVQLINVTGPADDSRGTKEKALEEYLDQ